MKKLRVLSTHASQKRFDARVAKWLKKVELLRAMQENGYVYVRRLRKKIRIAAHTREAHYAWIPMRAESARSLRT